MQCFARRGVSPLLFFFDAEQSAQKAAQALRASDDDDLHINPCLSALFYAEQAGNVPAQVLSARVSTTTSAPVRVAMVMQSEPSAYSLLMPSG